MTTTKVSTKGQVVIPKALRDELSIAPGMELTVTREGRRIVLEEWRPRKKYTLDDLAGFLKFEGPPVSIEEMKLGARRATRKRWSSKTNSESSS